MVKNYLFSVIRIVAILITFFNSAFAQSKHAALWNFHDDIYLDFNTMPATERKNNPDLKDAVWYVDSEGEIALVVKDYQVYNKEMVLVKNSESFTALLDKAGSQNFFFIPVPTDENLVYLFHDNNYVLIDVNANQVISEVKTLENITAINHIAVHSSDCKGVWLIYYDTNGLYKFLITEDGISRHGVIDIKNICVLGLSKDCRHFILNMQMRDESVFSYFNVCYGEFSNGDFIIKNEFTFPITKENKFSRENILNVVLSEDKIYYTSLTYTLNSNYQRVQPSYYEIYKADIVSGVPDYEHSERIFSEEHISGNVFLENGYCGIDGRVYIFNKGLKNYFVIYSDESGNIKVEKKTFNVVAHSFKKMWFVSSWFSEKQCNGNDVPCSGTSRPKIICE
jgi:hypothetical protein